jgi:hypothetical protein
MVYEYPAITFLKAETSHGDDELIETGLFNAVEHPDS